MSSDGSSGITQFGLYRTIDARTEEFLRLSRKRQIRQGCACAAVSTAITVTVVVSVLLVYEYSIISGSIKNKSYVTKPTWLGFINDSADTTAFDAKYSKAKLNLDKTTIKLLPILLKTLKQNIFLEKVIEEYTSASPVYESSDTTERSYEKNVFSDPRNWFKAPTSRVYAIEFKTSPIVYYQPKRNLEYMTKIRKIRDYKRILNYFEKMINDKVTFGSNLAMIKRELQSESEKSLVTSHHAGSTTAIRKSLKSKEKHRSGNTTRNVKKPPVIETKNCKCPIKLGDLLNKLMGNINQLLPYSKMSLSTLCTAKKPIKLTKLPSKSTKNDLTTKSATLFTTLQPVNVITTPNYIAKIKTTTEISYSTPQKEIKKETTGFYAQKNKINLPITMNIVKDEKFQVDSPENHIDKYEKPTTVKNYLEATEFKITKPKTTKPMDSVNDKFKNFLYHSFQNDLTTTKPSSSTDKINDKSILSNEEYDDYFISTQRTDINYDNLDVHNLELIKTKISPNNNARKLKNKSEFFTKNTIKSLSNVKSPNLFPIQRNKNKDFSFESSIDSMFLNKLVNTEPKIKIQKKKTKSPKAEKSNEAYKFDHNIVHNENQFGYDDKMLDEEIFEEYKIKQSPKSTEIKSNIQKDSTPKTIDTTTPDKIKENTENNENLLKKINSMLPQPRPVYLEIQRNDWKQDDNHDYDFNANNNLYDFPI